VPAQSHLAACNKFYPRESDAALFAYDFSDIRHIKDIGGGGHRCSFVTFWHSILRCTVEFSSSLTPLTKQGNVFAAQDGCERLSSHSGEFFVSVPEKARMHLLCGVIHDWDDERAIIILRNCSPDYH
jgi:hypothetical protein